MPTVFTNKACLQHDPGPGHPETPRRLQAVLERMQQEPTVQLVDVPPLATLEPLLRVHPQPHLDFVRLTSERGGGAAGPDTLLNPASWDAVLGATGAVLAGIHHAHQGRGNAFAAVRPPGHHALAQRAMGFCLVSTIVVAAREARHLGRERVLIVDWDVHHGNGTEALVEDDPSVRYVSLHQWPWYPGTGRADERGTGNIFNVPRPPGLPPEQYVADLWDAFVSATRHWKPDILLLSAGFDAMAGDPLGGFTLEPEDFARLTSRFREHLPDTPIVSMLEGGYAPTRVAEGVAAHVRALR
ncbi:MAG TPA: histone deacetylase [Gemmatimonadales bacterium]|nr:histone deacetylase [Gemmatimonadales bacterium]